MAITDICSMLIREEGCHPAAYPDPLTGGVPWTIGVGHTGPEVRPGLTWTDAQIHAQLALDISIAQHGCIMQIGDWIAYLDEPRCAVLIGMAFQMGITGLCAFHRTLTLIEDGDYAGAADAMLQSKWAAQTPVRAGRMAQQMRTGEWQQ